MFERDLARDARRAFSVIAPGRAQVELDLGRTVTIGVARLEEDITRGQSVARYTLYGAVDRDWQVVSHGSTIGYAKLDRFEPVAVRRVRLAIEDTAGMPQGIAVKLYNPFGPVAF
jgi:alpha-L-fucosidase